MSPPNVSKLSLMFFSSESTAVNTDMTQKIPIVIPVSDRKDLSFDDLSSSKDNLRLWKNILKMTFTQRSYAKALISAIRFFKYITPNYFKAKNKLNCDTIIVSYFRPSVPVTICTLPLDITILINTYFLSTGLFLQ